MLTVFSCAQPDVKPTETVAAGKEVATSETTGGKTAPSDQVPSSVNQALQVITPLSDTLYTPILPPALKTAAVDSLRTALQLYRLDPENPAYFHKLGLAAFATGDFQEALKVYTEGAFKFPEDPRVFLARARVWLQLREPVQALSDLAVAQQRFREATSLMDYNAEIDPSGRVQQDIHLLQGIAHIIRGDGLSAMQSLKRLAPNNPVPSQQDPSQQDPNHLNPSHLKATHSAVWPDSHLALHFLKIFAQQQHSSSEQPDQVYDLAASGLDLFRNGLMQEEGAIPGSIDRIVSIWMHHPETSREMDAVYGTIMSLLTGATQPDVLWNQHYPGARSSHTMSNTYTPYAQTVRELIHLGIAVWHRQNGREEEAAEELERIVELGRQTDTKKTAIEGAYMHVPYGSLYLIAESELMRYKAITSAEG